MEEMSNEEVNEWIPREVLAQEAQARAMQSVADSSKSLPLIRDECEKLNYGLDNLRNSITRLEQSLNAWRNGSSDTDSTRTGGKTPDEIRRRAWEGQHMADIGEDGAESDALRRLRDGV